MVRLLMQTRHNFIPSMEWEEQLQAAAGLTRDQLRFAISFVACIFAGVLIRLLRSPTGAGPQAGARGGRRAAGGARASVVVAGRRRRRRRRRSGRRARGAARRAAPVPLGPAAVAAAAAAAAAA
jgi:hypothetical protein